METSATRDALDRDAPCPRVFYAFSPSTSSSNRIAKTLRWIRRRLRRRPARTPRFPTRHPKHAAPGRNAYVDARSSTRCSRASRSNASRLSYATTASNVAHPTTRAAPPSRHAAVAPISSRDHASVNTDRPGVPPRVSTIHTRGAPSPITPSTTYERTSMVFAPRAMSRACGACTSSATRAR